MGSRQGDIIADFAREQLGCGYIMGATGWICSPSRRAAAASQYPAYGELIRNLGAKWDGKRCFDCAQLTKASVGAAGGQLPSGATSQWNAGCWDEKGVLAALPEERGLLLFREEGGRMAHTGVYVGEGLVVEAQSTQNGVVETRLFQGKWSHWGRHEIAKEVKERMDEEKGGVLYARVLTQDPLGMVNLRSGPGTAYSRLARVPGGARVTVLDDGDDWWRVAFGGMEGYMACSYLLAEDAGDSHSLLLQARDLLERVIERLEQGESA